MIKNLMPYPFDKNGEKDVYGKVILKDMSFYAENSDIKCSLEISLISNEMIKYDSLFAKPQGESYNMEIQPYFYEFYFEGYIEQRVFYYLFGGQSINGVFIGGYESKPPINLRKFRILDEEEALLEEDSRPLLRGQILFSASPIVRSGTTLKIVAADLKEMSETAEKIDVNFDCRKFIINDSEKYKIEEVLRNSLSLDTLSPTVLIYNVGQGNNVFIEYAKNKGFFFDIGLTKEKKHKENASIVGAIKNMQDKKADMVILSHWDMDHILGITCADGSIYKCPWIAPNFYDVYNKISLSAQRLCAYLCHRGVPVYLLDGSFNQTEVVSIDNKFVLYKGDSRGSNGINELNNFGLLLKLNYGKSMLLTGDCEYKVMPPEIFNTPYEYMLVPHHGSKMSEPHFFEHARNTRAFVSVGEDNQYEHPDDKHLAQVNKKGYTVCETRHLNFPDIMFEISL